LHFEKVMQQQDHFGMLKRHLLLEQSALQSNNRIETYVEKKWDMHRPDPDEGSVVRIKWKRSVNSSRSAQAKAL